jgi:FkbM family methyltransferase
MSHDDLIIDVGMNNGDDTAYYLHLGFKVVAIEANPSLVAQAEQRFSRELAQGRLKIIPLAIAKEAGHMEFWINDSLNVMSSADREHAAKHGGELRRVEVPCVEFSSIIDQVGIPYFLKIDIEGNDHFCIDALEPGKTPRYISFEADRELHMLRRLKDLGYDKFKCISQSNFLPIELPLPRMARLNPLFELLNIPGRAIDKLLGTRTCRNRVMPTCWDGKWFLPRGSSGAFGERSPGRWMDYGEVTDVYQRTLEQFRSGARSPHWGLGKNRVFWADFHAGRPG